MSAPTALGPLSVPAGAQLAFGASGCEFGTRTAVTVGASTSVVLNRGTWMVECDAHTSVRVCVDAGSTFVTLLAASGTAELIRADGFNVELRGDGTGGTATVSEVRAIV